MMAFSQRFFLLIGIILMHVAFTPLKAQNFSNAQLEVREFIDLFFEAVRKADGEALQQCFHKDARLYTVLNQYGVGSLAEDAVEEFIEAVSAPKDEIWNEVIWSYDIQVDGAMASVWSEYSFFIETNGIRQLVHCGFNSIELFKGSTGWLITQITDIRKDSGCRDM